MSDSDSCWEALMRERVEIICGDITEINVDVMVNSASRALAGVCSWLLVAGSMSETRGVPSGRVD
ncbi:hypothetical protein N9V90_01235 [Endozoicomonas sp.]|nr:hypothetical protein [Endozoicomonas sp.]